MPAERRGPAVRQRLRPHGRQGRPDNGSLQDLKRRLYSKAKADKDWRFWGLYAHVAKPETLRTAYDLAKRNNGAPGIDGVTFEAIEAAGVEAFLGQLQDELVTRTYRPLRNRRVEIPKDGGTKAVRVLVRNVRIACVLEPAIYCPRDLSPHRRPVASRTPGLISDFVARDVAARRRGHHLGSSRAAAHECDPLLTSIGG